MVPVIINRQCRSLSLLRAINYRWCHGIDKIRNKALSQASTTLVIIYGGGGGNNDTSDNFLPTTTLATMVIIVEDYKFLQVLTCSLLSGDEGDDPDFKVPARKGSGGKKTSGGAASTRKSTRKAK